MPGKAIAHYIEQHASSGFQEIVSIFRHDFTQFLGMLQSWMVLIEAEILTAPAEAYSSPDDALTFRQTTAQLQGKVDRFFKESRSHLYPTLDNSPPTHESFVQQWDTFYSEFRTYARPRLIRLEKYTRRLVAHPAFAEIIETTLGAAAGDDTIEDLILKPYTRLREVLDAERFDARIAEMTQNNNASV